MALVAGAPALPRQDAARCAGAPAAGAAAGGGRLRAAGAASARAGAIGAVARRCSASASRSAGPARRGQAIMGFPLMVRAIRLSIEAIDRRLEAGGRARLGREAVARVPARSPCRWPGRASSPACAGLRQGAGRIRRHHHLRLQHPRRNPDPLARRSTALMQVPGGEVRHLAAGAGRGGDLAAARCCCRNGWCGASAKSRRRH